MFKAGTLFALGLSLLSMVSMASAGCASSGAVPQPFPVPGGTRPGSVRVPSPPGSPGDPASPALPALPSRVADGYAIAGTALSLRGAPYRNGGADPSSGFDCSGFVWYVFGQHGIKVPRSVSEQFREGTGVTPDALEAGDLVFFSVDAPGASHVGMIIGADEFVHAPSARGLVRVERISSSYWASRYVGARRLR
jgi:cell wall-associated NlpC family hydrolase